LTLSLATTLGDLTEVGAPAATTAATILAAAAALGIRLDSELATTMGARAESNRGRYFSVSPDMVVALHGQPSVLTRIMDGSPVPEDPVRLPSGVQFLGIDFGTRQEDAESRFDHARTCAAIGQVLIDRILRHESPDVRQVKGRPTPVSVADYVEKVRDRIPTKLKGADFLALYPDARSLIPSLDPAGVYKVRSRTEHPIYEFARCRQFLECLHRACRNGDMEALIQAGELMYSSHWSYGQRCALGSAEADFVVSHLRRLGPQSGIFGAKMSGIGCGGVVVVFARSKEKSEAAIESTLQLHEKKFGRKARALFDSSPGGWLTGARRV